MRTSKHNQQSKSQRSLQSEARFIESFKNNLLKFFRKEGHHCSIHHEVQAGRSIADLVILLYSKNSDVEVIRALSAKESAVLAFIRTHGPTDLATLKSTCGLDDRFFHHGPMEKLISSGIVYKNRRKVFSLSKSFLSKTTILAFEAKLTRWKQALHQATSYKQYADMVYVILPSMHAGAACSNSHQFKINGIGLATVNNRDIDIAIKSKKFRNHDWKREYVYSRILADCRTMHL